MLEENTNFGNISFEYALEKLRDVVNRLEIGKESLDSTVKLYNEGMELVNICKKSLDNAEKLANKDKNREDQETI